MLKRNRTAQLIHLLPRLEKGEQVMSFREFDLSVYINAFENFRPNQTEQIVKHQGSVENSYMFIQKIKEDESEMANLLFNNLGT